MWVTLEFVKKKKFGAVHLFFLEEEAPKEKERKKEKTKKKRQRRTEEGATIFFSLSLEEGKEGKIGHHCELRDAQRDGGGAGGVSAAAHH